MEKNELSPLRQSMHMGIMVLKESVKSFLRNNDFEMAMALGTQGVFALIPLIFFAAYLLSYNTVLPLTVTRALENLIGHAFPLLDRFLPPKFFLPAERNTSLQVVSIFMVLLAVMSLADTLRTTFLKVFRGDEELSFLRGQRRNALAALVIGGLCAALLLEELFYTFIVRSFFPGFPLATSLFGVTMSIVTTTLCMFALYTTFPPVKLHNNQRLAASVVTAGLMVLMHNFFSLFITNHPEYGSIFGSLKALFLMNLWIYYCFIVILFGAEIIVNVSKKEALVLTTLFTGESSLSQGSTALLGKYIQRYKKNDLICREGETGASMYYILSGSVQVSLKDTLIRSLAKDYYFGEMSMLLDSPRTATVIAAEDETTVVKISQENFEVILKENPKIVLSILKEMTLRLKLTNENWL